MPVYEYKCPACGHHFEAERSIKDESDQECKKCGNKPCQKLISQSTFSLKGSGWYKDGY